MSDIGVKHIIEAALLAAGKPLTIDQLLKLFPPLEQPERSAVREAIAALKEDYEGRGIEITDVASGFRIQVGQSMEAWISRLWDERPPKYTRALLETLALIAYRQPITRGEIENVRGVSVSTSIMKTLQEREWVRIVGHRDVPGHPAMYGTTKEFLDYFNLKRLDELPSLAEIRDLDRINAVLDFGPSENEASSEPTDSGSEDDESASDQASSAETDFAASLDTELTESLERLH